MAIKFEGVPLQAAEKSINVQVAMQPTPGP
jgi:hypothetical protein